MSQRDVSNSLYIFQMMMETDKKSKELIKSLREAQTDLFRINYTLQGLARGDPTAALPLLARSGISWSAVRFSISAFIGMHPYVAAAIGVGAAVAGIVYVLSQPKPEEIILWKRPK